MIKSVIPASALLLLCSAFAFAAGGGAGGRRVAVLGVVSVAQQERWAELARWAPRTEEALSITPQLKIIPSPARGPGLAVWAPWQAYPRAELRSRAAAITNKSLATEWIRCRRQVQNKPGLPRVSAQDERIIAAIKEGNEKLGRRNPPNGQTKPGQPSPPANDIRANENIQQRNRVLSTSGSGGTQRSSAGKETSDPRSVQSKPDVSHMSEESQRLAREIVRDTDKLGKVGNPGNGNAKSQAQQDSLAGSSSAPMFRTCRRVPWRTPNPASQRRRKRRIRWLRRLICRDEVTTGLVEHLRSPREATPRSPHPFSLAARMIGDQRAISLFTSAASSF